MSQKILIDLKTRDGKRRAEARTIAAQEATGLKSAGFYEEHGDLLVVIAEKIDAVTVVDKIRKAGLRDAKLFHFE
ncbi:hypothetical protein EUGRSUZ_E03827 [Eucalyptus grandis]|uniref:Uncharacterized protein n=3 Tax=Eucalyptus TaxID=3932 RepID=A0ACC3L0Y2_EUCGR|nr:hypothetical protein EUGRSUZ_E03827 [Eucalyptus grandis]